MSEKEVVIERMANKIASLDTAESKSNALMRMALYESGKAAGIEEERRRWEKKQETVTT